MTAAREPIVGVGRDSVVQRLSEDAELTLRGGARTVLVLGEPGIGKSRVISDFAVRATAQGFRILRATAVPQDKDFAFATLRSFADAVLIDVASPPGWLPAAEDVLAATQAIGPREPVRHTNMSVSSLVGELLDAITREQPLLVVLDDAQFADADTLAAIVLAARRLTSRPFMLVLAARVEAWNNDAAFAAALGSLLSTGRGSTVELSRLAPEHIAQLLEQELGATPSQPLVSYVSKRSGGNPLFAIAIARVLEQGAALKRRGGSAYLVESADTSNITGRAAILQRFFSGDSDRRSVAQVLALSGPVRLGLVARLVEAAGLEARRGQDAFDGLVRSGLIAERRPGEFSFVHPLVAELLRDDIGPLERKRLHAEILSRLPKPADDAERAQRAQHLVASADRGDTNAIDEAMWLAIAMGPKGPLAAAAWYERAIELMDADDRVRMSTALMGQTRAFWKGSRPGQALAAGETALQIEQDPLRRRTVWSMLIGVAYAAADYPRAISFANRAMAEFPDDLGLKVQSCACLVTVARSAEADTLVAEIHQQINGRQGALDELTLSHIGFIGMILGDRALFDVASSRLTAIVEAAESAGVRSSRTITAAESVAYLNAQVGETAMARKALAYLDRNARPRSLDLGGQRSYAEVACRIADGDLDGALDLIGSASAALDHVGITANSVWLRTLEAQIHLDRARPDLAADALADPAIVSRRTRAGVVARVVREQAEARDRGRRLDRELVIRLRDLSRESRWYTTLRVALTALADDAADAGEDPGPFIDELTELAAAHDFPDVRFDAALRQVRHAGFEPAELLARSLAERHAIRVIKSGYELQAVDPDHEMLPRVGLEDLAARTGIAARARTSPASADRVPARPHQSSDELSPQDLELVLLVREGLNNREIADRLHFSRKTIEAHLSRLYRRFGCTSRVSLIVELTRRQLLDDSVS